jgi:hypothetical protein
MLAFLKFLNSCTTLPNLADINFTYYPFININDVFSLERLSFNYLLLNAKYHDSYLLYQSSLSLMEYKGYCNGNCIKGNYTTEPNFFCGIYRFTDFFIAGCIRSHEKMPLKAYYLSEYKRLDSVHYFNIVDKYILGV